MADESNRTEEKTISINDNRTPVFSGDEENDVYAQTNKVFGNKEDGESVEEEYFDFSKKKFAREQVIILKEKLKADRETIIVGMLYTALCFFATFAGAAVVKNIIQCSFTTELMPRWMFIILLIVPMLLWLYSTKLRWFSFYRRKKRFFLFSMTVSMVTLSTLLLALIYRAVMSFALFMPIGKSMNEKTVVLTSFAFTFIIYGLVMYKAISALFRASGEKLFEFWFRCINIEDSLPNFNRKKKFEYDLKIIDDMENGKTYAISEDDRRMHTLGLGSTGTGKTSAIETVTFESDTRKKALNTDYQKKIMHKLLEEGKVELTRPFDDIDFNIDFFKPSENLSSDDAKKIAKKILDLKFTAKNAGMTIFSPNTEFCDELYAIAKAKGIRVNRIDPDTNPDGTWKAGSVGFNPLYVYHDESRPDKEYFAEVFDIAKAAADVNQAIFEAHQSSDPYFAGLNRNLYVAAAICCIIGAPLIREGWYAKPEDVQSCLNNFENIKPFRNAVVQKYALKNERGVSIDSVKGAKVIKPLQFVIDRIDKDFLGSNAQKMSEQAVGLRNIVDESLLNQNVHAIFCSDSSLDFNLALAEGQITLINFNVKMTEEVAASFGLAILLNFITAVLRRPGNLKTRIPHFLAIDEAARLFHPKMELMVSLFRQYNVACTFFFQNLSQFGKNNTTMFLKGVFASNCAHQIIYGRAGVEEMKYISDIAGQRRVLTESSSVRESSLADEDTSKNTTVQYKEELENVIDATDVRYRRFLECTVLSVRNSTALAPFIGKTDFLPEYKRRQQKRLRYDDWASYYVSPETNPTQITFSQLSETHYTDNSPKAAEKPALNETSQTTISSADEEEDVIIMPVAKPEPAAAKERSAPETTVNEETTSIYD